MLHDEGKSALHRVQQRVNWVKQSVWLHLVYMCSMSLCIRCTLVSTLRIFFS